jgi:thioredoxin-like negative regulator of GroEL
MTRKRKQAKFTVQPILLIGVVLAVAVIFILKAQRSSTEETAQPLPTAMEAANAVVGMASPTVPATVRPTQSAVDLVSLSHEAQVDRLLAEKQPIFAFFHSNTCQQCVDMTRIVDQVYPEFEGRVYLVDVNVYDERNQNLLRRANLRVIPTLIFIDRNGDAGGHTGVMPADDLRSTLETLAGGG